MSLIPLTLLTILTANVGKAPTLPPWPTDLPAARINEQNETVLPYELSIEVTLRLALLERYPELCQVALDETQDYLQLKYEADLSQLQYEHDVEIAGKWAWWEVGGVGLAALLAGVGIGFIAGL